MRLRRYGSRIPIKHAANTALGIFDVPTVPEDTGFDVTEWQHPDSLMQRSNAEFGRLLDLAITNVNVSDRDRRTLRRELGVISMGRLPTRLQLANLRIRRQAYRLLYSAVRAAWSGPPLARRRWFFITLVGDVGNSLEYRTVVELRRAKRDFAKMLADTGLHAIGMLEIQAGANYPGGGHGSTLELHAHAIGFTDNPAFPTHAVSRALCGRTILANWLGAPTVRIDPITSRGHLRRQCYYMCKAPFQGSRIEPDGSKASGFRRVGVSIERPALALRIAEVLGHLTVDDAVFCTGKGGIALKGEWLRALREWHGRRCCGHDVDVPALIQNVWNHGRTRISRPPIDIRRDTSRSVDSAWADAMRQEIALVHENRAKYAGRRSAHNRARRQPR